MGVELEVGVTSDADSVFDGAATGEENGFVLFADFLIQGNQSEMIR